MSAVKYSRRSLDGENDDMAATTSSDAVEVAGGPDLALNINGSLRILDDKEPLEGELNVDEVFSGTDGGQDAAPLDEESTEKSIGVVNILIRLLMVLTCLFFFICSLDLLGSAFKLMGGEAAGKVFSQNRILNNPVAGLMIGVLVTVLLQSSSTSSSLVVAMVASAFIKVETAVPIIMGANIGTSVTNTIVALGQIQDEKQFERAFSAATVHDMFNILTVLILLPLEWMTSMLSNLSHYLVTTLAFSQNEDLEVQLLSRITDPLTEHIVTLNKTYIKQIAQGQPVGAGEQVLKVYCDDNDASHGIDLKNLTATTLSVLGLDSEQQRERCHSIFSQFDLSDKVAGGILLVSSLVVMFVCLIVMVKMLKSIFHGHISTIIYKTVNAHFPGRLNFLTGYVAILVGVVMTVLVQSSSIFTSTLTPLVGLNVISLERAFPLTLGSNIGTTVTSMLAALASDTNFDLALQISMCHLLFNVIGIAIWYPVPKMRNVPLACARRLGKTTCKYRWFAFAYVLVVFVFAPLIVFSLSMAGSVYIVTFCCIIFAIAICVGALKIAQSCCIDYLPPVLRDFKFLPKFMRSLEPFHNCCCGCLKTVSLKSAKNQATLVRPTVARARRITESSLHLAPDDDFDDTGADSGNAGSRTPLKGLKNFFTITNEKDAMINMTEFPSGLEPDGCKASGISHHVVDYGIYKLTPVAEDPFHDEVYKGKEARETLGVLSGDSGVPSSSSSSSSKYDHHEFVSGV